MGALDLDLAELIGRDPMVRRANWDPTPDASSQVFIKKCPDSRFLEKVLAGW